MIYRYLVVIILVVFGLTACTPPTPPGTAQPTLGVPTTPGAVTPTLGEAPIDSPAETEITEAPVLPTETNPPATPTLVPTPRPPFVLQPGTPLGTTNFAVPEAGCNWMGIGGQVFGPDGAPVTDFVIEAGGNLGGSEVSHLAVTGGVPVFGEGGYLIKLSTQPVASEGTLWLQLYDSTGEPQSNKVYVTTYAECERNLVLVNFSDSSTVPEEKVFLPSIINSGP